MKDLVLKCHPTATPPATTEAGETHHIMLPPTGSVEPMAEPEVVPRPPGYTATCARYKQWMNPCKQPHLTITNNSLTTVFLLQHCHITNKEDLMYMIQLIITDTM